LLEIREIIHTFTNTNIVYQWTYKNLKSFMIYAFMFIAYIFKTSVTCRLLSCNTLLSVIDDIYTLLFMCVHLDCTVRNITKSLPNLSILKFHYIVVQWEQILNFRHLKIRAKFYQSCSTWFLIILSIILIDKFHEN
jgi:hypothetical protein